jgi:hypothetical protein
MLSLTVMTIDRRCALRMTVAAAACAALFGIEMPSASSAPTFDDQGYVDSAARCTTPALAFGSTATSRVAICTTADGIEYRGVRLRDGAKLVVAASQSADGAFSAENNGITYLVTAQSLVISAGTKVIRDEPMLDFHTPQAPAVPTTSKAPLPPPLPAEVGGG